MTKTINILITGLGGQGVNALYEVLQKTILRSGMYCKGAIFKGGAQKRGSVYAVIRTSGQEQYAQHYSPMIAKGELDVLIGLEANEAARHYPLFNKKTKVVVNDYQFPFYSERFEGVTPKEDPIVRLKTDFGAQGIIDFNQKSKQTFGHLKMVNILMGLEAINQGFIPIDKMDFLEIFEQKVSIKYEELLLLMKE